MRIARIEIFKLFDLFDYNIPLQNEENLTIITGPNGFGKTMILNIIYNFFNKRFFFFSKLVFEKIFISIEGETNTLIEIIKETTEKGADYIAFKYWERQKNGEDKQIYIDKYSKETYLNRIEANSVYLRRMDNNRWYDERAGRMMTAEELLESVNIDTLRFPSKSSDKEIELKINGILENFKVHLVKEQRLFKRIAPQPVKNLFADRNDSNYMTDTIREYAGDLASLIKETLQSSLRTSQDLDSSFPKRLLNEQRTISIESFNERFDELREKQNKLKKYGLSESEQEVPSFDEGSAKVLLVYLDDTEQKLSVFDDLLSKLELFTNVLNKRRFTHKSIRIDKEKGFKFLTNNSKELNLTDLSSGEQHQVVLLYELIFKAAPNTLVLIDEPEISLHITWQKEFLGDLLNIISIQKMQVIIATHSPQIINNRWDLVYNLETETSSKDAQK